MDIGQEKWMYRVWLLRRDKYLKHGQKNECIVAGYCVVVIFEAWCADKKNGCIVAGYCVEVNIRSMVYR